METARRGAVRRGGRVENDKKRRAVLPKPENFIRWKNIPVKKGHVVSENGRNDIFVVIYAIESVKYNLFK